MTTVQQNCAKLSIFDQQKPGNPSEPISSSDMFQDCTIITKASHLHDDVNVS